MLILTTARESVPETPAAGVAGEEEEEDEFEAILRSRRKKKKQNKRHEEKKITDKKNETKNEAATETQDSRHEFYEIVSCDCLHQSCINVGFGNHSCMVTALLCHRLSF